MRLYSLLLATSLLAAFGCAGTGGATQTAPGTAPPATPTPASRTTIATATTAPTLIIVSVTSPVSRGAIATLAAQAPPGATVSITVYYKSGPSRAAGLSAKVADANGKVSWSWVVGTNTTPGSWRIVIETSGQTAETYFTVP